MAAHLLQVTLGSGATQVSSTHKPFKQAVFQNNAAHVCRIGDSTVSSSKGIQLASGSPGGSFSPGLLVSSGDLQEYWIFGTASDVIDVLYIG